MFKGLRPQKKNFYLNPVAILFLMAKQLEKILIAGRGFGKSFVNGILVMIYVATMPRSRGLLLGPTYTQILTNSLGPMKDAWAWFGYKEWDGKEGDYVVGKKPPPHFAHPYHKPDRYENVITWWNGTMVLLGSMDRPELMRGGNNDWSITDEALLIDRAKYLRIVDKTIRGSHLLLKDKVGHLSQIFTTSMPYGSAGKWLMDRKLLSENPKNDIYFAIGTSWHNRKIIGEKVLNGWKKRDDPLSYMVEVMSVYIKQLGSLFYPSLADKHWYTDSFDYSHIDALGFELNKVNRDSRWDKDCDPNKPLNISHDFGAFNCITIDQEWKEDPLYNNQNTVRFINFMHVSHPLILQDLAKRFCEYYKHHKRKVVHQYGDKSGDKREANSKLSYFDEFATILEKEGWQVIREALGDAGHLARHKLIATMHREEDLRLPILRYNANNCKDLRIALESAPMLDNKKDKSSERNRLLNPAHATHGTDAHDYRLWWGFRYRIQERHYTTPVSFGGG
jgi:hypothetical protein